MSLAFARSLLCAVRFGRVLRTVLAVGVAAQLGLALPDAILPAKAQFFDNFFGGGRPPGRIPERRPQQQQQGGFGFPGFFGGGTPSRPYNDQWNGGAPRRAPAPHAQPQGDFSRAPAAKKPDVEPTMQVVVLGDSMADWLAYGLEDAFADTPEQGVVRKHRTHSSLIRNDPKDHDWVQGAKEALAQERPDFIVVTIGMNDRKPIRERLAAPKAATKLGEPAKPGDKAAEAAKPGAAKPGDPAKPGEAPKTGEVAKPADAGKPAEEAKSADEGGKESESEQAAATEQGAPARDAERPGPLVTHEFRSERWGELYGKRVDDVIAAAKAKRVPVLWVGLPPLRGNRARADIAYLNDIYRSRAEKAGIVYV
ncbi:MAG: uncharacterized protein QOD74_10, partial [Variibacter sp.]|nr:uncharacterized protein [Variibacter sp.]